LFGVTLSFCLPYARPCDGTALLPDFLLLLHELCLSSARRRSGNEHLFFPLSEMKTSLLLLLLIIRSLPRVDISPLTPKNVFAMGSADLFGTTCCWLVRTH
jgi:hypothetical protein